MSSPLPISHAHGYTTNCTLGAGNVQVNSLRNIVDLDKEKSHQKSWKAYEFALEGSDEQHIAEIYCQ